MTADQLARRASPDLHRGRATAIETLTTEEHAPGLIPHCLDITDRCTLPLPSIRSMKAPQADRENPPVARLFTAAFTLRSYISLKGSKPRPIFLQVVTV